MQQEVRPFIGHKRRSENSTPRRKSRTENRALDLFSNSTEFVSMKRCAKITNWWTLVYHRRNALAEAKRSNIESKALTEAEFVVTLNLEMTIANLSLFSLFLSSWC